MHILVINSGSSSVKFALIEPQSQEKTFYGQVEALGTEHANLQFISPRGKEEIPLGLSDHSKAVKVLLEKIASQPENIEIIGTGHRVVHGGEKYSKPTLITSEVVEGIRELCKLAPLHNPGNLLGIEATLKDFPDLPQFAIFDTAFHQSIPSPRYYYPIPLNYYEQYGIRKYGFHGISYEYLVNQFDKAGLPANGGYLLAHLGNGCSAAAVENGKCQDTTMGLTPLEGFMMGTRSGSVDPSLHQFLQQKSGLSLDEITHILNKESGIKGISGLSQDLREVEEASASNIRAQLALDLFCFRLARELMALTASLTRFDGIVFTGGIGENSNTVRQKVIDQLQILGLRIQSEINEQRSDLEIRHLNPGGSKFVVVIKAGEEVQIAQHVLNQLSVEVKDA